MGERENKHDGDGQTGLFLNALNSLRPVSEAGGSGCNAGVLQATDGRK